MSESALPSGRLTRDQLLAQARSQVREVSTGEVAQRLAGDPPPTVIDIRERQEWAQGHVPGAHFIPRGYLELRIEETQPDRDAPIIL
jgi:adenylyltransferase/sulfurtransferase